MHVGEVRNTLVKSTRSLRWRVEEHTKGVAYITRAAASREAAAAATEATTEAAELGTGAGPGASAKGNSTPSMT
jgi:hypothetical protein